MLYIQWEGRGVGEGGGFVLGALPAIFPSVISPFLPKIVEGGGGGKAHTKNIQTVQLLKLNKSFQNSRYWIHSLENLNETKPILFCIAWYIKK